jgi:hypothetical protein
MISEAGFRPQANGSGLYVPDELSRKRIVCTYEDWKKLDRALDVLNRLNLRMKFRCERDGCSAITKITTRDGGTVLQCACSDRVFTKAF